MAVVMKRETKKLPATVGQRWTEQSFGPTDDVGGDVAAVACAGPARLGAPQALPSRLPGRRTGGHALDAGK